MCGLFMESPFRCLDSHGRIELHRGDQAPARHQLCIVFGRVSKGYLVKSSIHDERIATGWTGARRRRSALALETHPGCNTLYTVIWAFRATGKTEVRQLPSGPY